MKGLLGDIRVLDLAGMMGIYCTKQLADMGADVVRIEPPGGDPLRSIGPFYKDEVDPQKSLYFFLFNTNKRSITLNIETGRGQELFRNLATKADLIVESFPPGYMAGLGLGYESLKKLNPKLIMVSVTAYGQDGPYKDYKACDITGVAMGGLMELGGFPESSPNYPGALQGYYLAGINGTIGALFALCHRDVNGQGQHVDVSMHEAVTTSTEGISIPLYLTRGRIRKRTGRQVYRGWNELFPCKDGYVMCSPFGGAGWKKVLEWANSEGMALELKEPKYQDLLDIMADVQMDREPSGQRRDPKALAERDAEIAHVEQVWEDFLATHTKNELYEKCQSLRVRLAPIYDAADQMQDPQLRARNWFIPIEHSELGETITYPGLPYRFSKVPLEVKRAPLIGEHNQAIYAGELGLSSGELAKLKKEQVI